MEFFILDALSAFAIKNYLMTLYNSVKLLACNHINMIKRHHLQIRNTAADTANKMIMSGYSRIISVAATPAAKLYNLDVFL